MQTSDNMEDVLITDMGDGKVSTGAEKPEDKQYFEAGEIVSLPVECTALLRLRGYVTTAPKAAAQAGGGQQTTAAARKAAAKAAEDANALADAEAQALADAQAAAAASGQ